jgi:CRP-like cAMP-binding protein
MDFTRDLRESVATYAARYWIHDLATDDPTSSRVRARIYTALQRAQIPLAVPAHTAFVELKDEARTERRLHREVDQRFAALKAVHLLHALTDDELRTLAAGMTHVLYTTGEIITRQGATAHWLYVMTSGAVDIRVKVDPDGPGGAPERKVVVARSTAPDFFGEMGLMTGEPRSADVIAASDVECFRLGKDTFATVLLGRPQIVTELSSKLASRRVELIAAREGLDASSKQQREDSERERILRGIKAFFALN